MPGEVLANVFSAGHPIKTRFNHKDDWKENIIYKVEESTIEIEITDNEKYLDDLLAVGDSIDCRCLKANGQYYLEGWVSKIRNDAPSTIIVQIHKWGKEQEIKNESMHQVFLGCVAKKSRSDKGIFGTVHRVSRKEIIFTTKLEIPENQAIILEIMLTEKVRLKIPVEIINFKKMEAGIEYIARFIDADALNKKILDNMIDELENGSKEKYNRQNSYWKKHSKIVGK